MKKAIIFTLLCVLALSCAYTGRTGFVIQATPFALQNVSGTGGRYTSTNGFGVRGGFRHGITDSLSAGLDVDLLSYRYNELETDYNVIGIRAVVQYVHEITDSIYAEAEFGLGADRRQIASAKMITFGMDGYAGFGCRLSDEFALTTGAGIAMSMQNGKKSKSTDFAFKTRVGLEVLL